jgi:protein-S-isoprenylcysteine O-methyltransferase Ste14
MIINLLLLLWLISEVLLSFRRRAAKVRRRKGRLGSVVLVWIVIVGSIFAANASLFLDPQRFPGNSSVYTLIASIFILAGIGIRWWAIITLGRFFSVDIALQEQHQIVQEGPYRWIRHPAYTGLLIIFLGMGIAFNNWLSFLLIVGPITTLFLYRIKIEEDALSEELGTAYLEYRKKTKRLLPGIF